MAVFTVMECEVFLCSGSPYIHVFPLPFVNMNFCLCLSCVNETAFKFKPGSHRMHVQYLLFIVSGFSVSKCSMLKDTLH